MAFVRNLLPYLERGYALVDCLRWPGPAYLYPLKQGDDLVFEWTGSLGEGGEFSKPEIHSRAHVLTWQSDNWGVLCGTGPGMLGEEYDEDDPLKIEQAIAEGRAGEPSFAGMHNWTQAQDKEQAS